MPVLNLAAGCATFFDSGSSNVSFVSLQAPSASNAVQIWKAVWPTYTTRSLIPAPGTPVSSDSAWRPPSVRTRLPPAETQSRSLAIQASFCSTVNFDSPSGGSGLNLTVPLHGSVPGGTLQFTTTIAYLPGSGSCPVRVSSEPGGPPWEA